MNQDETERTEEFIADDSPAEMTQPHPGEFPVERCVVCGGQLGNGDDKTKSICSACQSLAYGARP